MWPWNWPRFGWPPEVAFEEVGRVIAKRNGKVNGYRGQYREIWLLMVLGSSVPATWGRITESLAYTTFACCFHRAFVLGLVPIELAELTVQRLP